MSIKRNKSRPAPLKVVERGVLKTLKEYGDDLMEMGQTHYYCEECDKFMKGKYKIDPRCCCCHPKICKWRRKGRK